MKNRSINLIKAVFGFPFYVKKIHESINQLLLEVKISKKNIENEIKINKAVIIHVSGGLANQMICYKAGRFISEMKKCPLILETCFYRDTKEGLTNRNFQLDKFPIKYDLIIYDKNVLNALKRDNDIYAFDTDFLKDITKDPGSLLIEFNKHDILCLDIWHSLAIRGKADHYAENNGILDELKLNPEKDLDQINLEIFRIIKSKINPVAVHVRRGDFIQNEGGQAVNVNFFSNAMKEFETKCNDPYFFIFSDDIVWCKKNLFSEKIFFVDNNDERNGYKDLFLASQCNHFILTQASTFGHQILELNSGSNERIVIKSKEEDKLRNHI
jgi:hypothetical protein